MSPRIPDAVYVLDEDALDERAEAIEKTELGALLRGAIEPPPSSRQPAFSRAPARIDGAYVVDEVRVDRFADEAATQAAPVAILLPSWRFDDLPWRSLVE